MFNLNIGGVELSIPIWIIELANKYVLHRLYLAQYKDLPLNSPDEFAKDFYEPKYRILERVKPLKNGWKEAIYHHLKQWRVAIHNDEQDTVRKFLVCPSCKKPMIRQGYYSHDEKGKYFVYRCLSGKSCANCNSNVYFAHYPEMINRYEIRRLSLKEANSVNGIVSRKR